MENIIRKLPRIKECNHRFDPEREPRTGCEFCWFSFFNNHADLIKQADECFNEMGKDVLERIRGKRFVKMFCRFMSTVSKFMEQQKAQNKQVHVYDKNLGHYVPVKDENGSERKME